MHNAYIKTYEYVNTEWALYGNKLSPNNIINIDIQYKQLLKMLKQYLVVFRN